ncbi:MAG: hypothetical protein KGZ39_03870 [Simkania sp.]|nr:hypothetical protein [Simkania sp.]
MQNIERMFDEMVDQQKTKLVAVASEIMPNLTEDDLLQPNDFPLLENHPYFRYEEGLLAGILAARMAFLASREDV